MTGARRLWCAAVTTVLAALSGLAFQRVFGWPALVPVVAVAATVPAVSAVLLSGPSGRPVRPLWLSMLCAAAGWLPAATATLYRGGALAGFLPTARTLQSAVTDLCDGWRTILTTILPISVQPGPLVLVFTLVWLAAFAGAELALRTRRPALPALPALAVFGVALLLGVDGPGSDVPLASMMLPVVAGLLLLRSTAAPGRPATLAAVPFALAVAVVAQLLGPRLPLVADRTPYDPRRYVQPPASAPRTAVSPLDDVAAWLQQPASDLFTVRSAAAQNWRLAVLDRFDGDTWTSDEIYEPTGGRVPAVTGRPIGGQQIGQTVTIQALTGVWLPSADRPTMVTGTPVDVAPDSGSLVSTGMLHPGLMYRVVSRIAQPTPQQLRNAAAATDPTALADLALPLRSAAGQAVPEIGDLRALAQQATAGSSFPFQEATRLADYLRDRDTLDPTAAAGQAVRNVDFFLLTGHRGTPDQFAAAFALMARTLGLPSRVVVGFGPGLRRNGVWQVRAGDVLVWPEVDFQGIGWVPFYPTPARTGHATGSGTVPAGEPANRRRIDDSISAAPPAPVATKRPDRHGTAHHVGKGGAVPWPWIAAAVLATALLGYLAAVVVVSARGRRGRRRARLPAGQIVGAWQECLHHLARLGLTGAASATAEEVVAFGAGAVGGDAVRHLRPLADLVNAVLYAAPNGRATADEVSARVAWQHSDAIRRLVAARLGRRRRVLRRLTLGG